mgnify:CR=1 FL=1
MRGKKVHLQPSARVDGDIYHNTIAIEQGAYFEGKSRRVEDPTADFEEDIDQDLTSVSSRQSHASLQDHLQHSLSRNSLYYGDRPKLEEGSLEDTELT